MIAQWGIGVVVDIWEELALIKGARQARFSGLQTQRSATEIF